MVDRPPRDTYPESLSLGPSTSKDTTARNQDTRSVSIGASYVDQGHSSQPPPQYDSSDFASMSLLDRKNFLKNVKTGTGMMRQFPHNYLDNATAFKRLLPSTPLFKEFSLATTQIWPFEGDRTEPFMYSCAYLYGIGRLVREKNIQTAETPLAMAVACGEILAPGLPDQLWLEPEAARLKLVATVKALLGSPLFVMFTSIGHTQRYKEDPELLGTRRAPDSVPVLGTPA